MPALISSSRILLVLACLTAGGVVFAAQGCVDSQPPEFDSERAFQFLQQQCDIGPRYPGSEGHRILRRYLVDKLEEFGADVSVQPFNGVLTTGDTLRLVNIIGNFNLKSDRRILLGAHYDTRPYADRDPDPANRDKPILGANDGASGVAVLLEISRLMKKSKPPVGVDIVFFDGEDYGREGVARDYILGSTYFAAHLKGYNPNSVIIVDMIGDQDLEIKREGFSRAASGELLERIFSIAEELGIEAFSEEEGPSIIDDHLPFVQMGIPAVNLIDFDYPYWHTLEDTPDKCSPASLNAVGEVLVEFIWGS